VGWKCAVVAVLMAIVATPALSQSLNRRADLTTNAKPNRNQGIPFPGRRYCKIEGRSASRPIFATHRVSLRHSSITAAERGYADSIDNA